MNLKLKKKDITRQFNYILEFGYCDIQFIEPYLDKLGYTCGTYGWNCDIYYINNNMCITTGYRAFGNIAGNKYIDCIKSKVYNYFKEVKDFNLRKNYINMLFNKLYCDLRSDLNERD